jgi:dipeptidyl-peptidase-4
MIRSILTGILVSGLGLTAIAQPKTAASGTQLTLKDVIASNKFSAKSLYGVNPMKDGKSYASVVYQPSQALVLYDFASGKAIDTLLKQAWLTPQDSSKPIFFGSYTPNADESMFLLSTDAEQIYRHSSRENNFVFDKKTKSLKALSPNGKQAYATFSPDGKKVGFMRENNLFIKDLTTGLEEQFTFDGKQNEIINGGTDWVYEE